MMLLYRFKCFFQGLSAGTLFYVALVEILMREKTRRDANGILQLLSITTGFVTILFIEYFAGEE